MPHTSPPTTTTSSSSAPVSPVPPAHWLPPSTVCASACWNARPTRRAPAHHRHRGERGDGADLAGAHARAPRAARCQRAPVCAEPAQRVAGRAGLLLPHHRYAERDALAGQRTARERCRPAPAAVLHDARRRGDGWQVEGAGRCAYLVGADGARSRVAQRTGLGQVRDTLYGVEREFAGLQVAQGNALHCFVSSATRRVISVGSRRIQPACRSDWRCVMTRNRYSRRISMASSTTCAMGSAFRLRRVPRAPAQGWCPAAGRTGRSPASAWS